MVLLRRLASLLAVVALSASVPINKDENSFGFGVQNTTYDNEQSVCVVDDVLYRAGDSLASANACERCVCMPPDFVCSPVACPMSPGCRAVQRSGHCCPDYHCECELNGQIYQNGEKVQAAERPCHVCYCRGGYVVCAALECYRRPDCAPRLEPGACCPKYDHCPPLENIHRKRPQFPVPTTTGDTDNHIHRTLLLDEDQQLDSTNTDERILRLGEASTATIKLNSDEIELPQSDEAPQLEEKADSSITENSIDFNVPIQEEIVSEKEIEVTTAENSFENLQTHNSDTEVKNATATGIDNRNKVFVETTQSTPTTQPNLEIQANNLVEGTQTDLADQASMEVLSSKVAESQSEGVAEGLTTEISKDNWSHGPELQQNSKLFDASERNTFNEKNSNTIKAYTEDVYELHLTTISPLLEDEELTEKLNNVQNIPTEDYQTEIKTSKNGEIANLEVQEHHIVTTTLQPEKDDVFLSTQRDVEEYTEGPNDVQNDLPTEETWETSHNFQNAKVDREEITTESSVHHTTVTQELESETGTYSTVEKMSHYDNNSIKERGSEETESLNDNTQKLASAEIERAETQRTSPIITNIRVTDDDDDEYDGGVITDDAEESTDDDRPPITTDKIFYSYVKSDNSKPTTIEAFAVADNSSKFVEGLSTISYDEEYNQTVTETPSDMTTEKAFAEKHNEDDKLLTTTTEYEEITLKNELLTEEGITNATDLSLQINMVRVNASSLINETKLDKAVLKRSDNAHENSNATNGDSSSGIDKLTSQNVQNQPVTDKEVVGSLQTNENSLLKYDTTDKSAADFEPKRSSTTSSPDDAHSSEMDTSDVFVREEPPVLLFKDEMAIHQMDVVVADDNEEEEATNVNEQQNQKASYVIPQSTTTDATTDAASTVLAVSTETEKVETKKLLENGYMTGFLNDDNSAAETQDKMIAESFTTDATFTMEPSVNEQDTYTTGNKDLTTTEEVPIPVNKRNSMLKEDDNSLTDEEYLTSHPEPTTEDFEISDSSDKQVTSEIMTEPPVTYQSTMLISDYTETLTSNQSPLKTMIRNDSPNEEASKILPEVVPLRQNESLNKNDIQQNYSESRQEISTADMLSLPQNWLKQINNTDSEESTETQTTTAATDSTEEFGAVTSLNNIPELTTVDPSQIVNSEKPNKNNTGSSYNEPNDFGHGNEGQAQRARERNFHSEDSDSLDTHDLLVLQEFFRKLYLH